MSTERQIDVAGLAARLAALPGIDRLRAAAERAGVPAYLVGGGVRDLLLGGSRADLDLVVEGDPAPLVAELGGEATSHARFGTATVRAGELRVDIARARAERYPHPGALPEVGPATLADDLVRRDFTINAMALPLSGGMSLIDPHGGARDLRTGLLRVLRPDSFRDDPTRALRAARYAARLDLALEPETERLLRRADLSTVSTDRVEAELRRIAAEPRAVAALRLASSWGLIDFDDADLELAERVAALIERRDWTGAAEREDAILAAARGEAARVADLVGADPQRPSEAVRLAAGRGGIELLLARAAGARWLDRYVRQWRHVRLEIDGDDLLAAGIEQGPAIGRGLRRALDAKLDGRVSGRDEELAEALRAAGTSP